MFGLDPFSQPVAIAEILLLLALAAFVGWALGLLILSGRVSALRTAVADKEAELEECRRQKFTLPSQRGQSAPASSPVSVAETPSAFIHADPLEPALSFNHTPEILVDDEPTVLNSSVSTAVSEIPLPGARLSDAMTVAPAVDHTIDAVPSGSVASNSEAAVLSRIAARAGELNFDRIGRATAAEADDLKDIVGVGPFLERKLHSLGIYTFRQVANFTKEDIDKVNEIIEFFPGRIERDNWVGQSHAFHERKYGKGED